MKINFDSQYKDVLRIVNSPVDKPVEEKKAFSKLLSDFEPKTHKTPEIIEDISSIKSSLKLEDSSVMARYSFADPELQKPEIPGISDRSGAVKTPSSDVKTPTIVGARRISPTAAHSSKEAIHNLIDTTGVSLGIDPALSLAVAKTESSFNPNAVSADGHYSKGLFQLLDSTGKQLHSKLEGTSSYDPFNPKQNARLGVEYLRHLHEIFSKETPLPNALSTVPAANSSSLEKIAVAAFNAGEGRVASAQARAKRAGLDPSEYKNISNYLPESTQQYVQRVLSFREQFDGPETEGNGTS